MNALPKLHAALALALASCCLLLAPGDAHAASTIAFRAVSTNETGTGANTLTVGKPTGTVAGDVMIATVNTVGGAPTAPAGWTEITHTANPGWTGEVVTYYKVAGAGEPGSYGWGLGGSFRAAGAISSYSGVDSAHPIGASAAVTRTSRANGNTVAVDTLAKNSMVISNATWQRAFGGAPTVTADPTTVEHASFSSSSSPREGIATSDLTQAAAGTSTVQTFNSTNNVPWTLQTIALTPAGGTLAFSTAPDLPNLPGLTLDGTQRSVTAAMTNFAVDDETGSQSGWNVTVNGDASAGKSRLFARYCPSIGGCGADAQGYPAGGASLAANSLTLDSTGASFTGGVGTAPTLQCGTSCTLDVASPVKVASAASGGASATWTTTGFGAASVALAAPTTVRALPASEVYRVDLLWTLGTGP